MSPERAKSRANGTEPALRFLGLAARAGSLAAGTEAVRDAVRAGRAAFVVVAADVSENTEDKLLPLLRARGIRCVQRYDRAALGAAAGRAPVAAVAVLDPSFARRLAELIEVADRG